MRSRQGGACREYADRDRRKCGTGVRPDASSDARMHFRGANATGSTAMDHRGQHGARPGGPTGQNRTVAKLATWRKPIRAYARFATVLNSFTYRLDTRP